MVLDSPKSLRKGRHACFWVSPRFSPPPPSLSNYPKAVCFSRRTRNPPPFHDLASSPLASSPATWFVFTPPLDRFFRSGLFLPLWLSPPWITPPRRFFFFFWRGPGGNKHCFLPRLMDLLPPSPRFYTPSRTKRPPPYFSCQTSSFPLDRRLLQSSLGRRSPLF